MDIQIQQISRSDADMLSDNGQASKPVKPLLEGGIRRLKKFSSRRTETVRTGGNITAIRTFVSGTLMVADMLAIIFSAVAAEVSSGAISIWLFHQKFAGLESIDIQRRLAIWAVLALGVCCWFALRGTYTVRNSLQQDIKQCTTAFMLVLLIDGFVEYETASNFSRLWITTMWVVAAILVPVVRVHVRKLLVRLGIWQIGAVVMGQGEQSEIVDQFLSHDRYVGYADAYRSNWKLGANQPLPVIAAAISAEMQRHGAEIVILAPDENEISQIDRVVDALNSNLIAYVIVPPIQRMPFAGLVVQSLPYSDTVLLAPRLGLMSPMRRKAKWVFDVAVSATMLLFLAPLFGVLALIISIDGGAPFYGHPRIGRGGKTFHCLKFRSMAKDADKILARVLAEDPEAARQWAKSFKLDNDPRITKIGKILRSTSLDELPQLINVVRGEMSLVGPRPVVAKELKQYYGEDAFYYQLVRPGITGLWQVSGRSDTTYDRRVFLDAWYVRNWDHWTDLAILFNTVPSVLKREGAR